MERIIKRDKNFEGFEDVQWIIKGEKGCIQFIVGYKLDDKGNVIKTYASSINYHSKTPIHKHQEPYGHDCELTDGICYCDGRTDFYYLSILKEKGIEALWKELEEYYQDLFERKE